MCDLNLYQNRHALMMFSLLKNLTDYDKIFYLIIQCAMDNNNKYVNIAFIHCFMCNTVLLIACAVHNENSPTSHTVNNLIPRSSHALAVKAVNPINHLNANEIN